MAEYTILIVDDEPDLLEMYQEFLEMEGHKVYAAPSAIIGMEIFTNNPAIQIIISDSHMPGMSGIDFLKKINELPQKPLFYLATGDLDQTNEFIQSLGGTGMIGKPFDLEEVLKRIDKDLNGKA